MENKENSMKTTVVGIVYWWSSTQAHQEKIEEMKLHKYHDCGETVSSTFYYSIHDTTKNSQNSFQVMESKGNTIKLLYCFY